jgi:hypothetical protein
MIVKRNKQVLHELQLSVISVIKRVIKLYSVPSFHNKPNQFPLTRMNEQKTENGLLRLLLVTNVVSWVTMPTRFSLVYFVFVDF